jgi:hypothetical protein
VPLSKRSLKRISHAARLHACCWDDGAFDFSVAIGPFHFIFSTAPGSDHSSEPFTDYFGHYPGSFTLEVIDWRKGCGAITWGYVDSNYFGHLQEIT